jgi:hypothetical protein
LRDTLANLDGHHVRRRLLAFDGDPAAWLPTGWSAVRQPRGGLDRRLAAAFADAGPGPAMLVGMDTPQVGPVQLAAFDPHRYDACLGPATDGGFWAIGFADPAWAADAVIGVPMSRATTGAEQLRRLLGLGLRVQLLDELTDVDDIASAESVAALIPDSRFAHALTLASSRVGVR